MLTEQQIVSYSCSFPENSLKNILLLTPSGGVILDIGCVFRGIAHLAIEKGFQIIGVCIENDIEEAVESSYYTNIVEVGELPEIFYKIPDDLFFGAVVCAKQVYDAWRYEVTLSALQQRLTSRGNIFLYMNEIVRVGVLIDLLPGNIYVCNEADGKPALQSARQIGQTQTEQLLHALHKAEAQCRSLSAELESVYLSRSWRMTLPMRRMVARLRAGVRGVRLLFAPGPQGQEYRHALARAVYHRFPLPEWIKRGLRNPAKRLLTGRMRSDYVEWIRCYDTLTDADRVAIRAHIAGFANPPLFSVIMPVYNAPEKFLRAAIDSVRRQIYPHWELCIADDASSQPYVRRVLEEYANKDARIKVVFRERNGHISAASNSALDLAIGDYIALLDQDDELTEHALYWMAAEIVAHPDAELLYSDEDKIDIKGRRFDPYFKPDWNPDLLLGQNYISHLGVYRRSHVLDVGGFRERFEGSQDWDLALRFTDNVAPESIRHIPAVLYHWRSLPGSTASSLESKPYTAQAGRKAVTEHLLRRGAAATLKDVCNGAFSLPSFAVQGTPLVSIVIPTRNGVDILRQCLDSLGRTDYPNIEVIVIDNQSDDPEALAYLAEIGNRRGHRVLSYPHPFDYAAMHNWAVPQAQGEYICLLNNDVEVITPAWLSEMLGLAQQPGVGAVGAKLLYPDGAVQHAGVVLGLGGIASHLHRGMSEAACGYFGRAALLQTVSAVTAACMVLRKEDWLAVGGMERRLPVAFNDVDLCLRLREQGLRNVWTPSALLYHYESKTRGADTREGQLRRFAQEHAYMQWRWGALLSHDPAYNPNLTLSTEDFSLAYPPRRRLPWRQEPTLVAVPFGLGFLSPKLRALQPHEEMAGSFPIPLGLRGHLTEVAVLLSNYKGRSDGTLVLRLEDGDGAVAQGYGQLAGSADNALLPLPLSEGLICLRGQDRLHFRFRLENASHPVALRLYPLSEAWGHGIDDEPDKALRIVLHVEDDA